MLVLLKPTILCNDTPGKEFNEGNQAIGGNGGDGDFPDPLTAGSVGGNGGNAATNTFGGGIYCDAGSGAVISNCTVNIPPASFGFAPYNPPGACL